MPLPKTIKDRAKRDASEKRERALLKKSRESYKKAGKFVGPTREIYPDPTGQKRKGLEEWRYSVYSKRDKEWHDDQVKAGVSSTKKKKKIRSIKDLRDRAKGK